MKYVLITPARNEEAFIERTLQSVTAQTVLPERWVMIDDGSTDRTGDIIESYTGRYLAAVLGMLPGRKKAA